MAKIETYVLANAPLSGSDKLIGTDTANNNATKNFSISELIAFITDSDVYVPYTGATDNVDLNAKELTNVDFLEVNEVQVNDLITTTEIDISDAILLNSSYGNTGQVLTSQGSNLPPIWSAASTGGQGIQGPAGPAGPPGPVGPAGLNWQGSWSASGVYVIDDAVGYGGASWFCIANVGPSAVTPDLDTANWALLAAQGATGPAGATGAQGPQGPAGPAGASGNNTLQQVLNNSTSLTNGRNFQGTGAGTSNIGFNVNAFGTNAATNNSGTHVNAFGVDAADNNTANNINAFGVNAGKDNTGISINAFGNGAADGNTGNEVNAFGANSAFNNTGSGVNAFGYSAGYNNTFNCVNLLGYAAAASADDQLAMSNNAGFNARISYTNLTADRLYQLPNNSGTIALLSDIGSGSYNVYTAIIDTFTATAVVLQNTLGVTLTVSSPSTGVIRFTSPSAIFLANKTYIQSSTTIDPTNAAFFISGKRGNGFFGDTRIDYTIRKFDNTQAYMPNLSDMYVEIRVYP
jgi:hypothetical protein